MTTSQGLPKCAAAWLVLSVLLGAAAGAQNAPAVQDRDRRVVLPDSVGRDLANGRYWKAALVLEELLDPLELASAADRLILAEAQAGWRNWRGALATLTAAGVDTAYAPAEFWYTLGRVRVATGDRGGAAADFRRFLEAAEGSAGERDIATADDAEVAELVARSFLALTAAESGLYGEALEKSGDIAARSPGTGKWLVREIAHMASELGAPATVAHALAGLDDPYRGPEWWILEVDAWAQAGDTARALELLIDSAPLVGAAASVAALDREWRFRLAMDDRAGAVAAMEARLERTTTGAGAVEAARSHWRLAEGSGAAVLKRVAAALYGGEEYGLAVRAWRLAVERGAELTGLERLRLARAYNGSGDRDSAVRVYRQLSTSDDAAVGAEALRAWRRIRLAQGRHGDAATLERWLLERYPSSPEALDVVFFRAEEHRDAGRFDEAVADYRRASEMRPAASRAGLARMRWAQLHLSRGEHAEAARLFRAYLERFPNGRRWEEASYWAARAARMAGDSVGTGALLARIGHESPLSYYADLAAQLAGTGTAHLDALLAHNSPETNPAALALPPSMQDWLTAELRVLEVLDEIGLEDAAAGQVALLRAGVADSPAATLVLARAFNGNGRSIDGIGLGRALQEGGMAWNRDLLEVVYPFPHRNLIFARALETGVDPWLVAGLIRQESAFVEAIGSVAGALGLMQVMPATGRELARAIGPAGYETESLRTAEVNVHLGTRYLAELMQRYDGDLRLMLSAYNAGPTRANRWRNFPEFADADRFVERIPFYETRNYVKSVSRNRTLYRWLYGTPLHP